jgi:hypothetical membrane protein
MTAENDPRRMSREEVVARLSRPRVRLGGMLLAVASLQFFVIMFVEQALRPGYSDSANTISDLGVNIQGWGYDYLFNTSVVLLGILAVASLLLIRPALPDGALTDGGLFLLLVGIAGAIAVGLFPETSTALWGHAHDAASVVTFTGANLGLTVLGLAMFGKPWWERYAWISTFLGLFSTVALAFYIQNFLAHGSFLGLGEGGLERVVAFPVLLWAVGIGIVVLHAKASVGVVPGAAPSNVEGPA